METMIVARFFRTADLILQTENDGGRVGNGKWFHSSMKPQIHHYAQLLMSPCLDAATESGEKEAATSQPTLKSSSTESSLYAISK